MDPYPLVYDKVVLCLGFLHDQSVYDAVQEVQPIFQKNKRYPVLTSKYEAVGVPGLYFAGTLTHGKDFKRAAGGFVHGFRYTARALVRILGEQRPDFEEWPTLDFPRILIPEADARAAKADGGDVGDGEGAGGLGDELDITPGLNALALQLLTRLNEGSAAYQMVHTIGDGVVFQCDADKTHVNATYFDETPLSYFNTQHRGLPRITTSFGYNGQTRPLQQSVQDGTMFRVFIWYYPGDCTRNWRDGRESTRDAHPDLPQTDLAPEERELMQFRETLSTQYSNHATLPIISAFVRDRAISLLQQHGDDQSEGGGDGWLTPGPQPSADHTIAPELLEADRSFQEKAKKTEDHPYGRKDDFPPGHINVWVQNMAGFGIIVKTRGAPPHDVWKAYEDDIYSKSEGIERGEGHLIKTQHLDEFKAIDPRTNQVVGTYIADLSNGLVQDWLIGYQSSRHQQ
jgi:hypothetical protein